LNKATKNDAVIVELLDKSCHEIIHFVSDYEAMVESESVDSYQRDGKKHYFNLEEGTPISFAKIQNTSDYTAFSNGRLYSTATELLL